MVVVIASAARFAGSVLSFDSDLGARKASLHPRLYAFARLRRLKRYATFRVSSLFMRYLFPWGYARRVRLVEPSRRALKPFEVTKLKRVTEGSQGPAYVMLKFIMKSVLANWTPEQIAIGKYGSRRGNLPPRISKISSVSNSWS